MISLCRRLALLAAFVAVVSSTAFPQRDDSRFDFYARGPYRENVPKPQSILRFDVGQFHTNYALMERVIEKISLAASDRVRVLEMIRDHLMPDQRVFVGVVSPIDPRIDTPEQVRDRVLEAARYIPIGQLGTTDDCGFSPFSDDTSTSRDTAFAKNVHGSIATKM